ncbi:hypothetical protein CIPAW_01G042900 [Carya illinoinensis]|uniref:Uncharacterized protein n=1 Tax=Carya illinoinensis TaxID=32201 RepID=A0A8T1RLC4_CARIL|nr:hypothetical protein CIPAW_01G042900 [Carya illinoinensis]
MPASPRVGTEARLSLSLSSKTYVSKAQLSLFLVCLSQSHRKTRLISHPIPIDTSHPKSGVERC